MTYDSLASVPTSELERHLDILECLRDRGDFANGEAYNFFFDSGIPLLADDGPEMPRWDDEILPVLEELVSRDVIR